VNESCEKFRRALEDGEEAPSAEMAAHLEACALCAAHSRLLVSLGGVGPGGLEERRVQQLLMALPPAPWQRRRFSTWLPLALALTLVGVGVSMLGGVPAESVVVGIPGLLGNLGSWLGAWALDMLTVAESGKDALSALGAVAGAWLAAWLIMVALGSGWAAVALARRREAGD
jgi:hypothetical protein